jgi:hypothetical protein
MVRPPYLKHILLFVIFIGYWGGAPAYAKLDKLIIMGTGGPSGVYSKVGRSICNEVNTLRSKNLVRCIDYISAGSSFNVQSVLSRNIDIGIAGSDIVSEVFKTKQDEAENLRIVAILYEQPTAVIISKDSEIRTFSDFANKSINIGNIGSGKRVTANLVFQAMKWTDASFSSISELGSGGAGKAFCQGDVDIMIDILGHPSSFYQNIIKKCNGRFISLPSSLVDSLTSDYAYFNKQIISAKHYDGINKDTDTFGSVTLIVSHAKFSHETIFKFLEALFDDLPALRATHPALADINENLPQLMSIGVPLHEGAKTFFNRNKN